MAVSARRESRTMCATNTDFLKSNMPSLEANMTREEHEQYVQSSIQAEKQLIESIPGFEPLPLSIINIESERGYKALWDFRDLPMGDKEKGDVTTTVGTRGSSLLIADFCGKFFHSDRSLSIPELATIVPRLGYLGYARKSVKPWIKHSFFEKFVPNFYGIKSRRMLDINQIARALWDKELPVLLVKGSYYDYNGVKALFIAIVGCDTKWGTYLVYDPIYSSLTRVRYDDLNNAIKAGWILSH